MEIFFQKKYAEPTDPAVLKRLPEEALTIHKRSDDNTSLVIFVHGLGGSRYGEDSTWGLFPRFLFEDMPELDIGLYEYRTLLGRAKFWKSVRLSDEAEAFAGIIRDLDKYQTIFLVGHSMGGLLCIAAIAHLIDSRQQAILCRIGGLILMATPQTGSQRVPLIASLLSKDFQVLKPHGSFVTNLHSTFVNNRVVLDETRAESGDIIIPTWAVMGTSDHWVDKLSAGLNIPASRKKFVRGAHKEIVKPTSRNSDAYSYVLETIKKSGLQSNQLPLASVIIGSEAAGVNEAQNTA